MSTNKLNSSDLLFLGTHGHVTAIHKKSGATAWSTSLPRTGYSVVSILPEDGRLLCASGGHVFALDPHDGAILWSNGLSGLGNGIVYLATMQSHGTDGLSTLAGQSSADTSNSANSTP